MKAPAKRVRSGAKWSEDEYAAKGVQTLHLRLQARDHQALDELAGVWKTTRGGAVRRAVEQALAEFRTLDIHSCK